MIRRVSNDFSVFFVIRLCILGMDDDESITSEDEEESSMQMEEPAGREDSKVETEQQKADALKKQIGELNKSPFFQRIRQ